MPKDKKSFSKKFNGDFKSKGPKKESFRSSDARDDRGDRGDRQMYQATCATCGNKCEVPFRPSCERPVYCSTCFHAQGGGNDRNDRNDRRPNFDNKPRFQSNRPMFHATCAKCGKSCDVPFVPTPGKTVYCKECFGNKGGNDAPAGSNNSIGQLTSQLNTMTYKLDKILQALVAMNPKAVAPKSEEKVAMPDKRADKVVKEKKVKKTAKKKK